MDSRTSSLPSSLSHVKSYKTLDDLSHYVSELTDNFAIHLVTSNHVVAIYRTGDTYSYFDSNVAFISGLKNIHQLMEVLEKALSFAGYEFSKNGFLVEHFDVAQANSALTPTQKETLIKPIQTERFLLSLQDKTLGYITLNGKQLSRVMLYDFGTKLHLESSSPLLINSGMGLRTENLLAYLNAGKITFTASEYLEQLRGKKVIELIQATKNIPALGTNREIENTKQVRDLVSFDGESRLKAYELNKLLKTPIEESISALPYYLEVANSKHWPNRLTNAAGRISMFHGGYSSIQAARYGDTLGFALGTGEMSFSLISQLIEDKVVKITPQLIKRMRHGIMISRGFAGIITSPFDIYDLISSSIDATNAVKGSKEWRDSIAGASFAGGAVVSGIVFTALSQPGLGTVVGFGIILGQGLYSGASMVIEYKKYRLTTDEEFRLFWHTFAMQLPPEDVQYLEVRQNSLNELAENIWKQLKNSSIAAYATGIGEISFKEPEKESSLPGSHFSYPVLTFDGILEPVEHVDMNGFAIEPRTSILSSSHATILMGLSGRSDYRYFLSRIVTDKILNNMDYPATCLPAFSDKPHEYDYTLGGKRSIYRSSEKVTSYCENAMVIENGEGKDTKRILFNLDLVKDGVIVGRDDGWQNDFMLGQGNNKVLGGENASNVFTLTSNSYGTIFAGKNSTNILDASKAYGASIQAKHLPSFDRRSYVRDYKKQNDYEKHIYGVNTFVISANTTVEGNGDSYTIYAKAAPGYSRIKVAKGFIIFPDVALLLECNSFTYFKEINVLLIQLGDFSLGIANYFNKDEQRCNFELIDKHGSVIEPLVDLAKQEIKLLNLRAETELTKDAIPTWYKNITKANEGYKVYGTVRVKNSPAHMIYGTEESDIIPITKETSHAEGREGSDLYNVVSNNTVIEINNYAKDESLDLLYIPDKEIEVRKDGNNIHLYKEPERSIKIKDYCVNSSYQHLAVIDENKNTFIPLKKEEDMKLVPFYHGTNMFSLSGEKVASNLEIVVNARIDDVRFYKDGSNLLLVSDKNLVVRLEKFYEKQNVTINFIDNISFWDNKDKLSSKQLSELGKLAINYQDEIKSTYDNNVEEYVVANQTIHHNQEFMNGSLSTVKDKRVGVLVLKNTDDVKVSRDGNDLVVFVDESNIRIKNWNKTDNRISVVKFEEEGKEIRGIDKLDLSEEMQSVIRKVTVSNTADKQLEKLNSEVVNGFKYLLASSGMVNNVDVYNKLGFDSIKDQEEFIGAYASVYKKDKVKEMLQHEEAVEVLVWMIVKGYSDLSLRDVSRGKHLLLKDLDECFDVVIGKRAVVRLVRNLEDGDVVAKVERFIRHHKEELQEGVSDKQGYILNNIHQHSGHNISRRYLAIDLSNQFEIAGSSSKKPSSWINDLFGWVKSSVRGLLGSKSKETSSTPSSISQVDAQMDVNGTIMLLDLLIRKATGQKYIPTTADQSISPLEAQGYALNITKGFKKVVEQAGLKSGVSMHRLNIDFVGMHKEITGKIMGSNFNEISGILKSCVEKACPGEEAGYPGKLSPKKFDKFMVEFNSRLNVVLNQLIQQILHNGDGRLEVNNIEEQQGPKSYLNDTSVQGHLTRDKVKLIS